MYFKTGHFKRCSLSQISSSSSSLADSMPERGRGNKSTPASSILCFSQVPVEANLWCKIVPHPPGSGCFRASFCFVFLPAGGILIAASKALRRSSSFKLWQRDRINITDFNEWYRQTKKTLDWNRTCWCKLQPFLNSVLFFKSASKLQLRNMHIHQKKIFLIFVIFIVEFSFYIFKR